MYKFDGGRLSWVGIWSLFGWWKKHHSNPAVMENLVFPKFSRPIRLLDSLAMVSIKISIIIETYCITSGVLPKVSLKVKFFKIHNIILILSIDMSDRNVNPKVTQMNYIYFLIQFLLLIIIYILFKLQMPD